MSEQEKSILFLRGKRVALRPMSETDIPYLLKWVNDPDIRKFMLSTYPIAFEEERSWYETVTKKDASNILLVIVVNEKPIGIIGLHRINYVHGIATTGTIIGDKDYHDQGYGTEAKMLLLYYAFYSLNLRKICSNVIAHNDRSVTYSKKCGYVDDGRKREQFYKNGRYYDEIFLAVFKDGWRGLWDKYANEHDMPDQF